ncbi:ubiquitin--protein ligase [Ancylostoma duodenale]|uniref:Ubiquitin--protein ligase n=1 Tax=Ancylostoma duodenale TaxID=51022 RepID=A0A0C2CHR2_9BILA|nr:ubiquitin--protein ligase [Ancylostoma duodenale]
MSSSRRLQKELSDLKSCGVKAYESVEYDESNFLHWTVLLVPDKEPYNKGAFKVNIDFPADYPFKPPKLTLATKIYHPNIDDKGRLGESCLDPGVNILLRCWDVRPSIPSPTTKLSFPSPLALKQ